MDFGPYSGGIAAVFLFFGAVVQMGVSLRSLRGTQASSDFVVFDEWRNEYKWWQLWLTTKGRDHMRAFRELKKSEPAAYFRYMQVLGHLVGWVIVVVGTVFALIETFLSL